MIFKILKELLKTIIIGQKQKNVNYQTSLYEHLIFLALVLSVRFSLRQKHTTSYSLFRSPCMILFGLNNYNFSK